MISNNKKIENEFYKSLKEKNSFAKRASSVSRQNPMEQTGGSKVSYFNSMHR